MDIQLDSKLIERLFPEFPRTLDKKRFSEVFNALAENFLLSTAKDDESAILRVSHFLGQVCVDSLCFARSEHRKGRGKYKGRGFMQCEGVADYLALSSWWYGDFRLAEMPNLVSDNIELRFVSAFWKWNTRGCNTIADKDNFKDLTRLLHGGAVKNFAMRVQITESIKKTLRERYGKFKD